MWWLLGAALVLALGVLAVRDPALPELDELDAIEHARPAGNVDLLPRQ